MMTPTVSDCSRWARRHRDTIPPQSHRVAAGVAPAPPSYKAGNRSLDVLTLTSFWPSTVLHTAWINYLT